MYKENVMYKQEKNEENNFLNNRGNKIGSKLLYLSVMKKVVSVFFILSLLTSTVGVVINKHYCGGKLASTTLFSSGDCGCGDNEMDDGCCQNVAKFHQLDEDYNSSSFMLIVNSDYSTPLLAKSIDLLMLERVINTSHYLNYPPPLIERDNTVFFQSFRV